MLLGDLLKSLGVDAGSERAAPLVQRVGSLLTSEELQAFRIQLADFFRLGGGDGVKRSSLKETDHSTANLNAAGLPGGGAAVKHVQKIMERGSRGYVVFFRL